MSAWLMVRATPTLDTVGVYSGEYNAGEGWWEDQVIGVAHAGRYDRSRRLLQARLDHLRDTVRRGHLGCACEDCRALRRFRSSFSRCPLPPIQVDVA